MGGNCKGTCIRYKGLIRRTNNSSYVHGLKRCFTCMVYIRWDGLFCPCCGTKLAVRPKATKFKNIENITRY